MAKARLTAGMFLAVLGAHEAAAAGLPDPGYYRVTGVAANDTLNIRLEPDARTQAIGQLGPDARPVEVLEVVDEDGFAWGRVHAADSSGWVAMKFLAPFEVASVPGTLVPAGLACAGTEPFWSAEVGASGGIVFSSPESGERAYQPVSATTAIGRNSRFALAGRDGGDEALLVLAGGELCSDGMSDRDFNWRADLVQRSHDGALVSYEGCCLLPPGK